MKQWNLKAVCLLAMGMTLIYSIYSFWFLNKQIRIIRQKTFFSYSLKKTLVAYKHEKGIAHLILNILKIF